MTVIAEKTSPSGRIEYTLERLDDKSIVLTIASVHSGRMERTSYYPHVWQWVAESLGYVKPVSVSLPDSVRALQGWLRRAAAEVNDYGTEGNEDLYDALERGAEQLEVVLDVVGQYMSDSVKGPEVRETPMAEPMYGTIVLGWDILMRKSGGGETLHFNNLEQLTAYVQSLAKVSPPRVEVDGIDWPEHAFPPFDRGFDKDGGTLDLGVPPEEGTS